MSACSATVLQLGAPVVLASASPRRRALLEMLGIEAIVVPAHLDEDAIAVQNPRQTVELLALRKAEHVQREYPDAIVVGADTTVVLDSGLVLNKPADASDAERMLRTLSGRQHRVMTGVAVLWRSERLVDSRVTTVTFRPLADDEIAAYIASRSPLDKAGAYGIQDDCGATFVSAIEGCYYTVVGLPVELLYRMLRLLCRVAG
ncbi:MAG: Maf-like protein [Candidatus Kapaibacterium sp.]|nr:MAG: Maf-like protein [Candidatus Kapabacteria bacterium]